MGFLSKLKHHAKKLIGKQVDSPEEVAEKVTGHVEKVEKHVKKSVRKTKNKQKVLLKRLKRNRELPVCKLFKNLMRASWIY